MAKVNTQIDLDGMSAEELLKLANTATSKAKEITNANKQKGIDIIKKTMADYSLDNADLIAFNIVSKTKPKIEISKNDADFEIEGKYWKLGLLGKTPEFVIKALKDGNKLSKYIVNNKVTPAQADEKEAKLRTSKAFKTP